ncbi:MAG: ribonuclease, partial [Actinomycetia bacterium]|nr:ribonuclease [Actinomycetes bacterium]
MLENEPAGGPTTDQTSAVPPSENTTAAGTAHEQAAGTAPAKATRRRTTRRKAADPAAESQPAATGSAPAENPIAEPSTEAPVKAPAKRASRARKKAAAPVAPPEGAIAEAAIGTPEAAATEAVTSRDAEPAVAAADQAGLADQAVAAKKAPAKRASRSRKKALPAEPAPEPLAAEVPADELTDDELTDEELLAAEAATLRAQAAQYSAPPAMFMPPVVTFMAPDPFAVPAVTSPTTPGAAVAPAAEDEPATPAKRSRSRRRGAAAEPAAEVVAEVADPEETAGPDAEDDDDAGARSRRRRGRRGRGRGRGADEGEDSAEETGDETAVADEEEPEDDEGGSGDVATRRRRRRRRRGSSADGDTDDPPNTVVRVREPRSAAETRAQFDDEVQGVKGSTRLEAKRQRRRDGRDQGRRRPPVLSEAEFLARREAVDRVMVVRQIGERTQIAVLEDDVLVEHYVTKASSTSYAGNVYLGKVQNVLPSMEAAFVDIGKGRNAVLYAGEVNWDGAGMEGKPRKIEQALRSGDPVLVQVTKDPIGHKGARLTSQISLPGRFLVYVPEGQMTGISRKLPDTERKRLKDILKKIVPENAGVIIRTAAEGATEDELTRDVARLEAQWQAIKTKSEKGGAPALLHAEPDLVIRVIRDIFNEDFGKLIVEGDSAWEVVEQYVEHVSPELVPRLSKHTGESDVFRDLRIDEQLAKALDRKVWLPSGGSLVIDRTEAMTVVDVNTGKFTGQGGNLEETVTRNNLEAAEEIVRQLRLRDIGGIIVIDFIDMVLEANRELVLRRLTECLGRDRTKHQVAEVTSLGLVQMTRKRVGQGLLEVFSETCEHCRGRGIIVHTEPVGEKPKAPQPQSQAQPAAQSTGEVVAKRRRGGRGRGSGTDVVDEPVPTPVAVAAAISAPVAELVLPAEDLPQAVEPGAGAPPADSSPAEPVVEVNGTASTLNGTLPDPEPVAATPR